MTGGALGRPLAASSAAYSARTFVHRRRTYQATAATQRPAMAHENGCRAFSTVSQRSPSWYPSQARANVHGRHPSTRVEREAPERHAYDARRQRDERADHRQQRGEEDGRVAVAFEPVVSLVDLVRADQQVATEPVDERAAPRRRRSSTRSTSRRGCRSCRHADPEEREFLARRRESGCRERAAEEHRHLAGDRHARRFQHHQHEHGRVAVAGDRVDHELVEPIEHGCTNSEPREYPDRTSVFSRPPEGCRHATVGR